MAAVDGAGPLTRSRIEAFEQAAAVLSNSATQWAGHPAPTPLSSIVFDHPPLPPWLQIRDSAGSTLRGLGVQDFRSGP